MNSRFILLVISIIIYPLAVVTEAQTDMTYNHDEVVVTSGRVPSSFSNRARNITVIDEDQIKELSVQSIQDILNYFSGVDLKKRGPAGVQADISIRGGSFEQALILIDGIRQNDPQTAHHNLNIPVNIEDIERIEILKGPGSKTYGPGAMSGVVNIITKKGKARSLRIGAAGGQYGYYNAEVFLSLPTGPLGNRLSFSKSKTDGYRYNTASDINTMSYSTDASFEKGEVKLSVGYTDKKFGANSFYSPKYPRQWEHTKTTTTSLSGSYNAGAVTLTPRMFWRRNSDDYMLDLNRPDWQHNRHKTYTYGGEMQAVIASVFGMTAIGGDYNRDEINSSNLGIHKRDRGGVFVEHNITLLDRLSLNAGGFSYKYGDFGWKLWPGADIGYKLTSNLRVFASVGQSFRIPSFTDLYYNSPAQRGNKDLQPEEAMNYELGVVFGLNSLAGNVSVFRRDGKNLIDWIKQTSDDPWSARNITKIATNGIEAGIAINPSQYSKWLFADRLEVNYTYLESDKTSENITSLYVLDHLKHQLTMNLSYGIMAGLKNSWTMRYESRLNLEDHFITDTKLSYENKLLEVFVEATNLFNKTYMDIGGIVMPGRWIMGGIKTRIM